MEKRGSERSNKGPADAEDAAGCRTGRPKADGLFGRATNAVFRLDGAVYSIGKRFARTVRV